MNRAERRRLQRSHGKAHTLDCGCHQRRLLVQEVRPCEDCGNAGDVHMFRVGNVIDWPTGAELGETKIGGVSCSQCFGEREWVAEVVA